MKFITLNLILISLFSSATGPDYWLKKENKNYIFNYTSADKTNIKEYQQLLKTGYIAVEKFFDKPFPHKFEVYIHPDRNSLDSIWQQDWKMPGFKSECWMVASGVAKRIDIISPKKWDTLSCEHSYADKLKTQHLITHELVHVFHGQLNASGDFSDTDNIDWFVEGLATYASGQLDSDRMKEVKSAIINKTIPATLNKFWTGKLKYALSGSMVMYIDKTYNRKKLIALLSFNKKKQILDSLNISEEDLIAGWIKSLK